MKYLHQKVNDHKTKNLMDSEVEEVSMSELKRIIIRTIKEMKEYIQNPVNEMKDNMDKLLNEFDKKAERSK
jgi:hypothetical protein